MTVRLGLVAGEPSGDLIASEVLRGLLSQQSDLQAVGIGGPHLAACGMQIWHSMDALSVFGYVDALKRLPHLYRIFQDVYKRLSSNPPDVFVGIDAPDFNLRLEQRLRAQNIPTVHFVGPSIWAWRYERIEQIRRAVSHMLVLFPFEVEIYEREGIPVTYVGHPLADRIALDPDQAGARELLGLEASDRVIAVLPGSRSSEIRLMAPRFLQAAQLLQKRDDQLKFVVPMVNESRKREFEALLNQYPVRNLRIIDPDLLATAPDVQAQMTPSWLALGACDMALVTSGTATLETALFKRPMVISYVLSPMMRRIMAWKSGQSKPTLDWVGLPNVLCQSFVVPELLQDEATAVNLADAFWDIWCDSDRRAAIQRQFLDLHQSLRCDTASRASAAILKVLQESGK